MRPKSILLLILALGCGLVASIGISQVMERRAQTQVPSGVETEPIYVALTDINLGDTLSADMLKLEEWPKDKLPPDCVFDLEKLVGRRPRSKIYSGEPLRGAKLLSANSLDTATQQIPIGYRAMPVKVDATSGAAGLVSPGDRVDVQLYVKASSRAHVSETKVLTILEDIRVFATDKRYRLDGDQKSQKTATARTITLVLTPKQANKVALAYKLGDIRLIMRNPDDDSQNPVSETVVTAEELFHPERADRESERGVAEDGEDTEKQGGKGLLSFLGQMTRAAAAPAALGPKGPDWTMVILEGAEAREVEFEQDGHLPRAVSSHPHPAEPAFAPPQPEPVVEPEDPANDEVAPGDEPAAEATGDEDAPASDPDADDRGDELLRELLSSERSDGRIEPAVQYVSED